MHEIKIVIIISENIELNNFLMISFILATGMTDTSLKIFFLNFNNNRDCNLIELFLLGNSSVSNITMLYQF